MSDVVAPGQTYRHWKNGDLYYVLAVADYTGGWKERPTDCIHRRAGKDCSKMETVGFPEGEKLVVYVGLYDNPHGNRPCSRPLSEWNEIVDMVEASHGLSAEVRRYTRVS